MNGRTRAAFVLPALLSLTAACGGGGDKGEEAVRSAGADGPSTTTTTATTAAGAGAAENMYGSGYSAPSTTAARGATTAARASSPPSTTRPAAPTTTATVATTTTTTTTPAGGPGGTAITIQGFRFEPAVLNVSVGATVVATNKDSAAHTWSADSDTWDSGPLSQNQSYSFRFTQAGTFTYQCDIHPSMRGTVQVG